MRILTPTGLTMICAVIGSLTGTIITRCILIGYPAELVLTATLAGIGASIGDRIGKRLERRRVKHSN